MPCHAMALYATKFTASVVRAWVLADVLSPQDAYRQVLRSAVKANTASAAHGSS
jgi:hypothetical protein